MAEHLDVELSSFVTVADVNKVKLYMKNFGDFYNDQVSHASCILLSRTRGADADKVAAAVALLREKNPTATIVTTPWDDLTGSQILTAMSQKNDFVAQLLAMAARPTPPTAMKRTRSTSTTITTTTMRTACAAAATITTTAARTRTAEDEHEHHHHHDHEHEEGHCCHHDHDHDHEDHDEDHDGHEHGHCCHHHHHHGHDADEVFTSWGVETASTITRAVIEHALDELESGKYGTILRSKGIVDGGADGWLEFDYVPGEREIRTRKADVGGKLVVIGSKLDEKGIAALFGC